MPRLTPRPAMDIAWPALEPFIENDFELFLHNPNYLRIEAEQDNDRSLAKIYTNLGSICISGDGIQTSRDFSVTVIEHTYPLKIGTGTLLGCVRGKLIREHSANGVPPIIFELKETLPENLTHDTEKYRYIGDLTRNLNSYVLIESLPGQIVF